MIYIYIAVRLSSMFLPNFGEIGPPVLEKKIFEGFFFYHICLWWPRWSCDLDYLFIHIMIGPYDWPSGFREDL